MGKPLSCTYFDDTFYDKVEEQMDGLGFDAFKALMLNRVPRNIDDDAFGENNRVPQSIDPDAAGERNRVHFPLKRFPSPTTNI